MMQDLQEIRHEDVQRINLPQYAVQWMCFMKTAMNFRVPPKDFQGFC